MLLLETARWRGVRPSESCRLGAAPLRSRYSTAHTDPLRMAWWRGIAASGPGGCNAVKDAPRARAWHITGRLWTLEALASIALGLSELIGSPTNSSLSLTAFEGSRESSSMSLVSPKIPTSPSGSSSVSPVSPRKRGVVVGEVKRSGTGEEGAGILVAGLDGGQKAESEDDRVLRNFERRGTDQVRSN